MQGPIGHRLRLLRAERGLSLREAARRAGVVKETISLIERGQSHPYDVTVAKLAKAYDVPLEDLLKEPVPLADASEGRLQLEDMYATSAGQRRAVLATASEEELARYVDSIKRVVNDVWQGLADWEAVAADPGRGEREREVARQQLARTWQHLSRLAVLRVEAAGGDELPREELAGFIADHAGVGTSK